MEEDNLPLGSRFADVVESGVTQVTNVPVIRQGIQYLAGAAHFIDKNIVDPLRYASEQGEVSPEAAIGTVIRGGEYLMEKAEEGSQRWSEILNVDPRITGVVGPAIVETALAGAGGKLVKPFTKADNLLPPGGMSPQLATVGASQINVSRGAVKYQPPTVVELTITDPEFLRGIKPGIADEPLNRAAIDNLEKNLESIANRRAALTEKYANDPKALTRKLGKLNKEEAGIISTLENVPEETLAYGRSSARSIDPTEPTRITQKGEVVEQFAHQHHLAGKAQTAVFVKKMREVGDDDDLIALHSHARRVLNSMGNVDANMLDIPGKGHIAIKGATETQRARNVHSLFDLIGIEPNAAAVEKYIGDVKNADQLMDKFNTYIAEYMKPQKELAIKITKKYLADHRNTLSPKDLKAYDNLVSKLSGL
tara:strand:+ start:4 stop:1272 length:1269 start_codon:yes stop_codon:yes gene_type:complete